MGDVVVATPRRAMGAYLAVPPGDGPWPGVVVIHDVFGLSADLRGQCDWLADAGYLALGPGLFSWAGRVTCLRSTFGDLKAGRGRSFDEIEAARSWLEADDNCNGRIGIIGYCMGGGFSLLLAPGAHYAVSAVNYGDVPDDTEAVLRGACPVVASFGAKDRRLRGAADTLERALEADGATFDIKEYPEAGHSFLNNHRGGAGVLIAILGRIIGVRFHEPSAVDARRRIVDFFDQHLRSG